MDSISGLPDGEGPAERPMEGPCAVMELVVPKVATLTPLNLAFDREGPAEERPCRMEQHASLTAT